MTMKNGKHLIAQNGVQISEVCGNSTAVPFSSVNCAYVSCLREIKGGANFPQTEEILYPAERISIFYV